MTVLISDNGEFSKGLKFEARGSAHGLSHGPVYGSAGYLALRNNSDTTLDNTIHVQMSTDGTNWSEVSHNINITASQLTSRNNMAGDGAINGLAYINNLYVIYGIENTGDAFTTFKIRINTSPDGITWTSYTSAAVSLRFISTINYSNGVWHVFGTNLVSSLPTYASYSSTNLTTWTERFNSSLQTTGITYTSAGFTDVATDGTNIIAIAFYNARNNSTGLTGYETRYYQSTNNTTFGSAASFVGTASQLPPNTDGWTPISIAYGNGLWVVVGTTGKIYTSTDRSTWTSRTSGTSVDLYSVAYANGVWIIGGNDLILRSTNGTTWTNISFTLVQNDDILFGSNGVTNSNVTKPIYANSKWIISNYQSTDNGLTWSILDYQIPNKQPYIKYPYKSGWNTWKSMDFWVYIPSNPNKNTYYGIASELGSWTVYLETSAAGSVTLRYRGNSFTAYADVIVTSSFNFGQWNHLRLVVDAGSASWYLNGLRKTNITTGTRLTANDTLNIGYTAFIGENRYARAVDYFIDEFMLTDELLNLTSATTITVPTAPWRNNDYTSILLHFNTDFNDDTSTPIRNGSATVPATFTEVTNASKIVKTPAALTTTASLTTTVTKAVSTNASLSATAAITANLVRIKRFSSNLTVDASELTVDVRTRAFGAVLTSTASINAVPTKQFGEFTASLFVSCSLIGSLSKVKQFSASLATTGSTLIADTRTRGDSASLSVTAVLTSSAVRNRTSVVALSTTATQTATIGRIKQFSSSLVVGASELTVDQKNTRTSVVLATTAQLSTSATRRRSGTATISCQANIVVNASQARIIRASLSTTATLFASTRNVKRATANLVVGAFEITTARTINLDSAAMWVVPVEITMWKIQEETRLWTIPYEERIYQV